MKIVCCACNLELGEKPPFEDRRVTHAYCEACLESVLISDKRRDIMRENQRISDLTGRIQREKMAVREGPSEKRGDCTDLIGVGLYLLVLLSTVGGLFWFYWPFTP